MGLYDPVKKALEVLENCGSVVEDADPSICERCPIGQDCAWNAHDAGIEIKYTVCGMLLALNSSLEEARVF